MRENLISERFLMQPMSEVNVTEQYLDWLNSSVSDFISNKPKTMPELRSYVAAQQADHKVYFYGIYTREAGEHIGNIKFILKEQVPVSFEMGILIGEVSWQGKGVAKETIECFADYAKHKLGVSSIVLGVDKANVPAVKAYEKIGFVVVDDGRTDSGLTMIWEF